MIRRAVDSVLATRFDFPNYRGPMKIHHILPAISLLVLSLASCSKTDTNSVAKSSQRENQSVRVAEKSPPSKLCGLFTATEMSQRLGTPLEPGRVAGPFGTACQWSGAGDNGNAFVQIQVLQGDHFETSPDAEKLTGIGKKAMVGREFTGWTARVLTETSTVMVSINGGTASRDSALALLRETLARMKSNQVTP